MEKNYKLTIAYDGTRFFGWEHQPDKDTIQGKLEAVLERLQGRPVDLIGAGRTDAGVHARAMVASVHLDVRRTPEEIRDYMNRYLPDAIAVREVKEASDRFHARYNALGKTYRYTCFIGPVKPVFDRKYVTLLDFSPDIEKMRRAAEIDVGKRHHTAFNKAKDRLDPQRHRAEDCGKKKIQPHIRLGQLIDFLTHKVSSPLHRRHKGGTNTDRYYIVAHGRARVQ